MQQGRTPVEAGAEELFHGPEDAKSSSEKQERGDKVGSNTILLASTHSPNYPLSIMRIRNKTNIREVPRRFQWYWHNILY